MAKRRKKTTTLSKPRSTRKVKHIKRRRKSRKKGGMLSELFAPGQAAKGFKAGISGMLGGGATIVTDYALPNQPQAVQGLVNAGVGFLFATLGNMPNLGAGMAGVGGRQLLGSAFGLSEEGDANWADPIQELPMFMSEDGYALSEDEGSYLLSEDAYSLSENSYLPGYVPAMNY